MVDSSKMSVEEIVAHCRQADGDTAAPPDAPSAATTDDTKSSAPASPSKPASGPMDRSAMSVEDMLAAARGESKPAAAAAAGDSESSASPPEPASGPLDRSAMSVEDMLAAARGQGKPAASPAAKAKSKPKPKAKAAVAKPAATGPKDTASILAAARTSAKPGPIPKAEAAARAKASGKPGAGKTKIVAPPMPERPAYAQVAAPAAAPAAEDRRGFIATVMATFLGSALAVGFSSLALTNLLWLLGLARFMFPNILTEPPTQFKVGFPDDYAAGQVESKFKAQFGVWVVRDQYQGESQIFALKAVCTHLGCTPNWLEGEQKFKCPCHGSGFYKDGINFEGPAPRPLERYAIRLSDDGQLEVDKSRKFNEELGQWVDGASFYSA